MNNGALLFGGTSTGGNAEIINTSHTAVTDFSLTGNPNLTAGSIAGQGTFTVNNLSGGVYSDPEFFRPRHNGQPRHYVLGPLVGPNVAVAVEPGTAGGFQFVGVL
jgi:hypothetical protein